ncbi:MAG: hypothetical protein HWE26_02490 [Alteromonadaceae bacterium]|nr:hypothetical protein [Alteromonadaceae bacterium]
MVYKLSRKDIFVVVFLWGAAFFMLTTSIYELLLASFSVGEVVRNIGVAFLLFGVGLTPQFFSKRISKAFNEIEQLQPILFTREIRFYINNIGLSLLLLGWSISFLLWLV